MTAAVRSALRALIVGAQFLIDAARFMRPQWVDDKYGARLPWRYRLWRYNRLANAGRLQVGRLVLFWPLPWHPAVRYEPGYGLNRPSGVLEAIGRRQAVRQ